MIDFLYALIVGTILSVLVLGFIFGLIFGAAFDLARETKEKKWIRIRNLGISLWGISSLYVFYLLSSGNRPSWMNWLLEGL
jgi:hypothetical protein